MRFLLSAFVLLAALGLSGCYRPLYGEKPLFSAAPTAQEARLNSIAVAGIADEPGQRLRNLLIDRMYSRGRPAKPGKRLEVSLRIGEEHLGLQKDATTTRARLTVSAGFVLRSLGETRDVLLKGKARAIVNFSISDQAYDTLSAREDARNRGLREVADRIVTRLLLYLEENGKDAP